MKSKIYRPSNLSFIVLGMFFLIVGVVAAGDTYRVFEGLSAYVHNPDGDEFTVALDVRDINVFEHGPRELMVKVYDPDGALIVREFIPDDGIETGLFADRIAGWDHELQYYANLYAKGTQPAFRWSEFSNPQRLQALEARSFEWSVTGGKPGVYRIVLAGTRDHVVTLRLDPVLQYGLVGHPTWLIGAGDMLRRSYIYVPQGTTGLFFAIAEPDLPLTRHFKLTAPDGTVIFDGQALGGYQSAGGEAWMHASVTFPSPGAYDGELLILEVSEGKGAFLIKTTLQQPRQGAFRDYVGMGSLAVYCDTPELAHALQGGTFVQDDLLFWHPFQARFHRWLQANPLDGNDAERALRVELEQIFNSFRLLGPSDARGALSWTNLAYAMGYYGFRVFRPGWVLLRRDDVPEEVKAIINEGLIMAGDRLSLATGIEAINGNAFAQIPVALWYSHRATGDALQKERFEIFWDRWVNEGWGPGKGLSRSGDSQEHLSHDAHYGSYILDNWLGVQWVKPAGILEDATDDPRFAEIMRRYRELYTYLYCREANGRAVAANPWSSRTHMHPHREAQNWEIDGHVWKGEPGPAFTVSVNDGNEWFAARRRGYYMLTFHGRLAPEWLSRSFPGQCGFGGGIISQLTVPGKGPVLVSRLAGSYGEGMHPSNWRNFPIHSIAGLMWDGRPLISAISEHDDNARLEGNRVVSEGEVRNSHVRIARSYTFNDDSIECEARLSESHFANVLSIWGRNKLWSEVSEAWEMLPFMPLTPAGQPTAVTRLDADGNAIGELTDAVADAAAVRIDRGEFGVIVQFDHIRPVRRGAGSTLKIQLLAPESEPTAPGDIGLTYRLVPFGA